MEGGNEEKTGEEARLISCGFCCGALGAARARALKPKTCRLQRVR
jgi:hypothetical protein